MATDRDRLQELLEALPARTEQVRLWHESTFERELARIGLPLSTYTEWYWKIDLHNLFHFLRLRADDHAQLEIRRYATEILKIVGAWVPLAHAAFIEYQMGGVHLSQSAVQLITRRLRGERISHSDVGLSRREWTELGKLFGMED